ncbi:EAL and modified HD-GYP domain-containing signal transduction protein [Kosakonia oryzendophytica]|uniref:EAL and modified HD-GYP domain-containing signal transduction protein n=1 Tax=Kosakonia oryzendophytica TaxID=1005665 RepID=A0A1C4CZR8_9ENTR|nr:EAL domain-containing protein [Kosakonia oryzendophytica]AMO49412.1 signal transduction protein [Enterobacter sp. FY-07]TDT59685.1 EAL and modified HD-GYP domain-containing signal transduction protein [Enterobacter sp. AG5470]WBT56131.1 EAL domain-containing protein [Kosakonia oryzendophytica]SCC24481.1 EAL and modified HD-GYP domain-containing signal transduction protein [Kosakonia oryzendophytica]
MYSFVARQAIFDKQLNTVGYELLFRDSMDNRFPDISAEQATTQLIEEQFLSAPVGRKSDNSTVYVNFPYQLLVEGLAETLPKDRVVIEILEDAKPDGKLLETVKRLHNSGFRIALDDFVPGNAWDSFMPYVNVIKFDIRSGSRDEISQFIRSNRDSLRHTVLLAEKVETYDEFENYKKMGFNLFQGYFFSKPVVTKRNKLVQNRAFALKLMQEVNVESPNLNKIEDLLKRDVSLSFKIMRYAQNILYNTRGISGFRNQSLRDVVVYLGISEMRRFVLVACLTSFEEVSNTEIYYLSLIRAKFCELLAARTSANNAINDAFMVGLFSLLDVILGLPLDELLEQITVSPEVAKALQSHSGELYLYLRLARLYEQRIWKEANEVAAQLGLSNAMVSELMNQATKWADELPISTSR